MFPFTRANGEAHPGGKACMVRLTVEAEAT